MLKKLVLGMGLIIVLLIVGMVVLALTTDLNRLKPQFQTKVKDALGLELIIDGDIKSSFSPFGFKVDNIRVLSPDSIEGIDLAKIKNLNILVDMKSMLVGKTSVKGLIFSDASLNIIKPKEDIGLNRFIENIKNDVKIPNSSFKNVNINYINLENEKIAVLESLYADINNIDAGSNTLSLNGKFDAKKLITNIYEIKDIKGVFKLKDDVARFTEFDYLLNDMSIKADIEYNIKTQTVNFKNNISVQ